MNVSCVSRLLKCIQSKKSWWTFLMSSNVHVCRMAAEAPMRQRAAETMLVAPIIARLSEALSWSYCAPTSPTWSYLLLVTEAKTYWQNLACPMLLMTHE